MDDDVVSEHRVQGIFWFVIFLFVFLTSVHERFIPKLFDELNKFS